MEPLIALIATTLVVHMIGRTAIPSWRPWPVALRAGVAVMFTMTGIAHFVGMRDELIAMVPPALPAPEFLVTLTGILELAAAAALFWRPLRRRAAGGLALMLLAMFPANVYKAVNETDLRWDDTLLPRTVLQVVFVAAVVAVLAWDLREDRTADPAIADNARRSPQQIG
ncbi:hypothetical protein GOARA_021_00510 [Gordonia araii NBRC 100433]|uniref:DoxX family protein n=1 Tax=Gordonia araii NBRC 100433 TaxID=1073574 RepID=G7GYY9_9ACTN|nr:DoxX family membrane protein [Gordonia araii]NNG97024.1 DoxX family membrane protein [Gordonia araii NBRC 100433]GAB08814.1 hypothetical protein GOARA_021_00510 [Gordonia araii NBRC 100433]